MLFSGPVRCGLYKSAGLIALKFCSYFEKLPKYCNNPYLKFFLIFSRESEQKWKKTSYVHWCVASSRKESYVKFMRQSTQLLGVLCVRGCSRSLLEDLLNVLTRVRGYSVLNFSKIIEF